MEMDQALDVLAALSHPVRLQAVRALLQSEPEGMPTGDLVAGSGLPQSTFSTHLAVLARAGLVTAERRGRQQIQRVSVTRVGALVGYLIDSCCAGQPALCASLSLERGEQGT